MAGPDRRTPPRLSEVLGDEPQVLDLFQALRLVEVACRDWPRLGTAQRAVGEPLRLGQAPHLAFPAGAIADIEPGVGGVPDKLRLLAMGLFGSMGPLPLHLTAWAAGIRHRQAEAGGLGGPDERVDDPAFADFCDMIQHRALTLYYRAWATARPHVQHDRPHDDRFALFAGAVCGIALPGLRHRDAIPDEVKLRFAGLLGGQSGSPSRLAKLIEHVLAVPVQVEEFVGTWLELPRRLWTRLASGRMAPRLGRDIVVGVRSYQRQHRFRIRLGPMSLATYEALLPDGSLRPSLVDAARNTVDQSLDWDVRLVLDRAQVPAELILDGRARLGWTSWLWTATRARDADDLVLRGGCAAA